MPQYILKIGYSLHYFEGDYAGAINGNNTFLAAQPSNNGLKQQSFDLFNGNIATMVTTITNPNTRAVLPLGNAYKYDHLNRLKEARSYNNINLSGNTWNSGGTQMYYNAFDYDANGNIIHQVRKDDVNATIDDMSYYYEDLNGVIDSKYVTPAMKVKRNRLRYVNDGVNYDGNDIDPGMDSTNYGYDAEGRLTSDAQERIDRITWRVDGKVRKIEHTPGGAQKNLIFDYDAMGHRIAKHVYSSNNVWEKSTYYVLDAQGNTMAVYQHANDDVNHVITFAQTEKHIYGSSRLGINNKSVSMFGSQNATYSMRSIRHYIGKRTYELSNHLGNVLSVISDKVIPHNNGGTVDYWLADIRQSTDYSPFGVILKSRDLPLTAGTGGVPYRYGFQGQEKDNEIKSIDGSSVNYKYRMHDPRIGRFFAVDPMAHKYPHNSPYAFSENKVIHAIEVEGLEAHVFFKAADPGSTAKHELVIGMKISVIDERKNPNNYSAEDLSKVYRNRVRLLDGMSTNGRIDFQVAVIGSIDIVDKVEDAANSTVIHFVDDNDDRLSMGDGGYAAAMTVGSDGVPVKGDTQGFHIYISESAMRVNGGRTSPHETGHGLGLGHPMGTPEYPNSGNSDPESGVTTSESPDNIMRQSVDAPTGQALLNKQINMMIQEVLKDNGQKLFQDSNGDPTWKPKDSGGKANKKFVFK